MTKRGMTTGVERRAAEQLSFDGLYSDVPAAPSPLSGSLDISLAVRDVLADMLAGASRDRQPLDRFQVAAELSRLTGREISRHMLDRYAAPSTEDWRLPLELLPALVLVTGNFRLLEMVAEKCGCKILRGSEAMLTELGGLLMQQETARDRIEFIKDSIPRGVWETLLREAGQRRAGQRRTGRR